MLFAPLGHGQAARAQKDSREEAEKLARIRRFAEEVDETQVRQSSRTIKGHGH